MYIVFDTETTGFFNKSLALDHPHQGRVCQLAATLFDDKFNDVASFKTLIKPEGWIISPGAEAVHGINQRKCELYGIPMKVALATLQSMLELSKYKIAHNARFDIQMLSNETFAHLTPIIDWNKTICTMDSTTELCKLKGKIPGKYKWPKLVEAYQHIFKKSFDKAHDAMADVRACAEVFKWLVDNNLVAL